MINKRKKIKPLLFLIALIIGGGLILFIDKKEDDYKKRILEGEYDLTIGQIEDLRITAAGSEIFQYSYIVKTKKYKRSINSKKDFYKYKNQDNSEIRFLVIYLKDRPDLSLINTNIEFKTTDNFIPPKNLSEIPEYKYFGDSIILSMFK